MLNRREAILKQHAMLGASRSAASLFWQRYNLRWKFPEKKLGDLTRELVKSQGMIGPTAICEAWEKIVPSGFIGRAQVEQHVRGKLTILVDCKSTAHVLGRQHG